MDLEKVEDFAKGAADAIARFSVPFTISSDQLCDDTYELDALDWQSICYGDAEIENVPNDRRGIYAFAVCRESAVLPPHCYVLYIGIAGKNSDRSLRERYKDYLNEKKVLKRERIARMIGTWHAVLRFFFAPIDDDVPTEQLQEVERQLNSTLLPPFSEGDLEADIKRQRRAFR